MDWDILIPILMFLFPLVVATLDKRAQQRKGIPPVKAEPVFPPAEDQADRGFPPEDRNHPRFRKREGSAVEDSGRGPAQQDVFREESPVEGERAIVREKKDIGHSEKPKLEIDKKKLILYSEILKPKFDA